MAGSLIKIDEFTISSAVASVTLGGGSSGSSGLNASIDSTYDVYMLTYSNVGTSSDGRNVCVRVTKSGSADTTANYDYAYKVLNASSSFSNASFTNENEWTYLFVDNVGTGTSETASGTAYLFNFANASEFSFITAEMVEVNLTPNTKGNMGGGVHTVASASDGLHFFDDAGGNIASGTFTLYGLIK
jgi:hypothetical protein